MFSYKFTRFFKYQLFSRTEHSCSIPVQTFEIYKKRNFLRNGFFLQQFVINTILINYKLTRFFISINFSTELSVHATSRLKHSRFIYLIAKHIVFTKLLQISYIQSVFFDTSLLWTKIVLVCLLKEKYICNKIKSSEPSKTKWDINNCTYKPIAIHFWIHKKMK